MATRNFPGGEALRGLESILTDLHIQPCGKRQPTHLLIKRVTNYCVKHDQIKIVQKTLILENVCVLNILDTELPYFSFDFINVLRGKMLI